MRLYFNNKITNDDVIMKYIGGPLIDGKEGFRPPSANIFIITIKPIPS